MSGIHSVLGKRAFELLPPAERNFWKSEQAVLPGYCDLPDLHLASQWDGSGKLEQYARYGVMPNGRVTPHGPVDENWFGAALGGQPDAEKTLYVLRYYLKKIIGLIRRNQPAESALFAGTLAHFIQDCSSPGHIINNVLLNHLFPVRHGKLFPLHGVIDGWPFESGRLKSRPELLGRTADEAAFLLNETLLRNAEIMTGEIIPLCQSIQAGRTSTAGRIMDRWNRVSTLLTASVWHTAYVIARGKIPPAAERKFRTLDLTRLPLIHENAPEFDRTKYIKAGIPFYDCIYPECDPCRSRLSTDRIPFEPAVNTTYDGKGNAVPLALISSGKRLNGNGIAAGSYGVASFRVPGTLYSEFDVLAGVHPDSGSDAKVTFGVWCPELPEPLLARGEVSRLDDALHFHLLLPEKCRTLSLLSAGGNSKLSVVWLNPQLISR
ncbi:MAG: hypothetical protein E7055_21920 [Lentisphaerae bacterium]|nr:hypothetical protein [Lentisphaerota bacterium]